MSELEKLLTKALQVPAIGIETVKISRDKNENCYFCDRFPGSYYWTFSLGLWKGNQASPSGAKGYKEEIVICSDCFTLYINMKPQKGQLKKFLKYLLEQKYSFNPSLR